MPSSLAHFSSFYSYNYYLYAGGENGYEIMQSGAPTVVVETAAHPTELDAAMAENAAYTSYPGDPTAGVMMENAGYVSSTLQSAVGDEEGNVAVESLTATVMENVAATAENNGINSNSNRV